MIDDKKTNFKTALVDFMKNFKQKKKTQAVETDSMVIGPSDFKNLSAFEKKTIQTLGKMFNLFNKNLKSINYYDLVQVLDEISVDRTNYEKQYLLSLFFPERVKHVNVLYPFPVPTYPYIQKQSVRISPNTKGNFVIQAVCPLLLDSSMEGSSVLYINSDDALTGMSIDRVKNHYVPYEPTNCIQNAFNAYVLQSLKISVEYVGRNDIQSGFFGGGYYVSTVPSLEPDFNVSLFNYIDDSINSVKVESTDGLNVIYYPLDISYTNFMPINQDNIVTHNMNTNIRLAIYGSSLPPGNETLNGSPNCINLTICSIYNIIPSPLFTELLPVDFLVANNKEFSLIDSAHFVQSSKLSAFPTSSVPEIERLLELPSSIKEDAINQLAKEEKLNGKGFRRNLLDLLHPLLKDPINYPITVDKSLFEQDYDNIPMLSDEPYNEKTDK